MFDFPRAANQLRQSRLVRAFAGSMKVDLPVKSAQTVFGRFFSSVSMAKPICMTGFMIRMRQPRIRSETGVSFRKSGV
jgi:hypothetical protein